MEHSGHLHPEFGLFSPTARFRREMRIAATSVLFGGIAGALCVSGVIALHRSDRAAMEFAEGSGAPASKDSELGTGPSVDGRGATPEVQVGTAAPQASAEESPLQGSGGTSAGAVAPASDVAPKTRMVRIRRTVESPAIARVPLGRTQAPAAASPGDAPESTQASNAAPAGNDVPAAAPEKAGVRPGAREAVANSSPKKKVQKTVRTASSRRDDIESDFSRDERTDDWSARTAAPASADVRGAMPEKAVTRTGARDGLVNSSPPKTVRNASSRRNDTGDHSFWRDEGQDDWRARAAAINDGRSAAGRAYAREAASSFRGFWDWSR